MAQERQIEVTTDYAIGDRVGWRATWDRGTVEASADGQYINKWLVRVAWDDGITGWYNLSDVTPAAGSMED